MNCGYGFQRAAAFWAVPPGRLSTARENHICGAVHSACPWFVHGSDGGSSASVRGDTLTDPPYRLPAQTDSMLDELRKSALEYHRAPVAGKVEVTATKSLLTQRD